MLVFRKRLAIITTTGFHTIATMSMIVETRPKPPWGMWFHIPLFPRIFIFFSLFNFKSFNVHYVPWQLLPQYLDGVGVSSFFRPKEKNIVGRCLSQLRNGNWLCCKHEKREAATEPTVLSIVKLSLVCVCTRLSREEAFPFIACIE